MMFSGDFWRQAEDGAADDLCDRGVTAACVRGMTGIHDPETVRDILHMDVTRAELAQAWAQCRDRRGRDALMTGRVLRLYRYLCLRRDGA